MFQVLSHFERCPGFDKKRYVKKIAGGVIDVLVTGKYKEDPIRNEGARVLTTFSPL